MTLTAAVAIEHGDGETTPPSSRDVTPGLAAFPRVIRLGRG
jgi:hypothetical protein